MGMYKSTQTNGKIVVRNSAFGGWEVHYGSIHLPFNYEQLPAAALKKALPLLAHKTGETPVGLVAKIEDDGIRAAMEEHLANLLDNMRTGVAPVQAQMPPQTQFSQYGEPMQKTMHGNYQPQFIETVDKWKALEILLNKCEERNEALNEAHARKPNLANLRKVDGMIHGISTLISRIETMTEAQFAVSKLASQIPAGRINEAIAELNRSADQFKGR